MLSNTLTLQSPNSRLFPQHRLCQKCQKEVYEIHFIQGDQHFYCRKCEVYTKWNQETQLQKCNLNQSQVEKLLLMFLDNKSPRDAFDFLKYSFVNDPIP